MKHAILVTAYKNIQDIIDIIKCFDDDFSFYIHIDKKSKIPKKELADLMQIKAIKFLSKKYKTNWGGFNHLRAILFLSAEALKDPNIEYFHLISGSHYPLKSCNYFKNYFTENKGKEYLEHYPVPSESRKEKGDIDRLEYYNFYDLFDEGTNTARWAKELMKLQKRLKIKRSFPKDFPKLYGGSTWWSLSRKCIKYATDYAIEYNHFLNRFRYTFCSEEFYFQTVILNSCFSNNVINDNLLYIDWNKKNGRWLAPLDISDYEKIVCSGKLFARKLTSHDSSELKIKLSSLH